MHLLDLSHNRIPVLPAEWGCLNHLTWVGLNVPHNKQTNKRLTCPQNNQLSVLPEAMSQLVSLQFLNISNNQFSIWPNVIILFTQLEELHAGNNFFYEIPYWLGQMKMVRQSFITTNTLKTVTPLLLFNSAVPHQPLFLIVFRFVHYVLDPIIQSHYHMQSVT